MVKSKLHPNFCFHCNKSIDSNDNCIQLWQQHNGRFSHPNSGQNYVMVFHIECFEPIAGKEYLPLNYITP